MTPPDKKAPQLTTEYELRSPQLSSQLKTPRHRPSWLFRVKLLSDILFRTRGGVIALFIALFAMFSGRVWNVTGAFWSAKNMEAQPAQSVDSTVQAVTLHTAKIENISTSLTLTGTVVPQNLLNIASPLSGLPIEQMRVEIGDRVSVGQVLAVLDGSVLQAQLQQAEANLAQAKSELQQQRAALTQAQVLQQAAVVDASRYSSLFDAGAISQEQLGNRQIQALTTRQQVEVANANLESAQANIHSKAADIERIKALMAQTIISAPNAGTVAERFATIGDTANTSSPLYSIIENHQLILELRPEQAQLPSLEPGMPVNISATDSEQLMPIVSTIDTIEPTLDAQSRQATVKVRLPNSNNRLRAGMFLQAEVLTGNRRSIVVPADAIVTQPNGSALVFTISDLSQNGIGSVQPNTVEVAERSGQLAGQPERFEFAEILSGLPIGSQVVVGGASYLQAGDEVAVVSEGS